MRPSCVIIWRTWRRTLICPMAGQLHRRKRCAANSIIGLIFASGRTKLSRAWMLEGIASVLPNDDPRRAALMAAAEAHRRAGLAAVTGAHYEGGHWLRSFAVYLTMQRGIQKHQAPNSQ